ncbi:MAG: M23 family metallopeptidase [Lewinellaceae bacterium]|nr:M23 family metallopeptidase [Lewinellaceae bacterium]
MRCSFGGIFLLPAFSTGYPPLTTVLPAPEITVDAYPKDYFKNPVDDVLKLAGTFGELRPGHFHTGLDIKSKTGGTGQPVMAAAEGYIYQIKVLSSGYGNVLYLRHPNGYTTLYAHLDHFAPEIEQWVKEQQYKRERFQVVLKPTSTQFRVKAGQVIGALGNSGGSSGPHLHFEIRNTSTQRALNPELFGLPINDQSAPQIRDMKYYILDEEHNVLKELALPVQRGTDGVWRPKAGDTLRIGASRVGFAVKVYDKMGGLPNDNGIYALTMTASGQKSFEWRAENISFAETRYLNAHVDYSARQRFGAWFHRCFVLPGDYLSNYTPTNTRGAVFLKPGVAVPIQISAMDASGNSAKVAFVVVGNPILEPIFSDAYNQLFPFDIANVFETPGLKIALPKGALYEDCPFSLTVGATPTSAYSPLYTVGRETVPLHKNFELRMQPSNLPTDRRKKAIIARKDSGKPVNCGGVWSADDMLLTKVRDFGNYCIMTDTEPPSITPVVFDRNMTKKSSMSFRINDNFETDAQADGLRYKGTIDGNWVLFEYDAKRDRLTYTFDEHVGAGEHQLRLVVTDDRGNTKVLERSFIR